VLTGVETRHIIADSYQAQCTLQSKIPRAVSGGEGRVMLAGFFSGLDGIKVAEVLALDIMAEQKSCRDR